jgi:hypothetical protein
MPFRLKAEARLTRVALALGAITVTLNAAEWLTVPEVPVSVTTAVPAAAELLAVRVTVLVASAPAGVNARVTPFGKPVAVRVTLPLKPLTGAEVRFTEPAPPWGTLTVAGATEKLKFGTATATLMVAVLVRPLEEPVIVATVVPATALEAAVKVTVLVPVVLAGLKDAVTPLGKFDAVKPTLLLKPLSGFTVRVLVAVPPGARLMLVGDAPRL